MTNAFGGSNLCYLCGSATARMEAGGLGYWKCADCGLTMRENTQTGDLFIDDTYGHDYYANPESYPQWDNDPRLQRVLDGRIETVSTLKPARGRLLDVGTGLGHFMLAAQARGWEVSGVEPSSYAREMAGSRTRATVHASAFDLHGGAQFDCVTMWDVLEHDGDPLRLLVHVRDMMRPKGLLAVSMPNLRGLEARLRGRSWRFFRPEFGHMTHHTPSTVALMLRRVGFEVARAQTDGSLNISGRLEGVLPDLARDVAQRSADRVVAPLGLGRNLTVYAWSR